jgi:hypothetical protein
MYHDLWAPGRVLMPAKLPLSSNGTGVCTLISDGRLSDLQVGTVHHLEPLWAQESDYTSLDALVELMVRPTLQAFIVAACMLFIVLAWVTGSHALQRVMEQRMSLRILTSLFFGINAVLCMSGLLGALQAIPSVAAITTAVSSSTEKLLELFIVVGAVTS